MAGEIRDAEGPISEVRRSSGVGRTTPPMIADEDRFLVDATGVRRKVFAGKPVPLDLQAAYEVEVAPKAKKKTAKKK